MLVAPRVETACWTRAQRLELMAVEDEATAGPETWDKKHPVREHNITEEQTAQRVASQEGSNNLKISAQGLSSMSQFSLHLSFPTVK